GQGCAGRFGTKERARGERHVTNLKTIRTDVVGSLLRPANLKEARAAFDEGRIDAAAFRAAEDTAVASAVRLQEGVGLDVISDGEMRRLNFQDSFGAGGGGDGANSWTVKSYRRRGRDVGARALCAVSGV